MTARSRSAAAPRASTSCSDPPRGHQNSSASPLITQSAPCSVAARRAIRVTHSRWRNGPSGSRSSADAAVALVPREDFLRPVGRRMVGDDHLVDARPRSGRRDAARRCRARRGRAGSSRSSRANLWSDVPRWTSSNVAIATRSPPYASTAAGSTRRGPRSNVDPPLGERDAPTSTSSSRSAAIRADAHRRRSAAPRRRRPSSIIGSGLALDEAGSSALREARSGTGRR